MPIELPRSLMPIELSTLSPAVEINRCEHILNLTALMLGNISGTVPELASPSRLAIMKIRMAIENQLTDPNCLTLTVREAKLCRTLRDSKKRSRLEGCASIVVLVLTADLE